MPESAFPNRDYKITHLSDEFQFSHKMSGASMTFNIYGTHDEIYEIVRDLLGWSRIKPGTASQLERFLPARHMITPYMTARSCKAKWIGQGERNEGFYGAFQQAYNGARVVNLQFQVEYITQPYSILTEEQVTNDEGVQEEWLRFVEPVRDADLEVLLAERGLLKWLSRPPGLDGNPRQGWSIRYPKETIRLVHHQLPYDLVFGSNDQLSPTLANCWGKLNQTEFMGNAPGTLLMLPSRFTFSQMPVPPDFQGLGPFTGELTRQVTVEHQILKADPTYFPDDVNGPPLGSPARGWQLLPSPVHETNRPHYWYPVARVNDNNDPVNANSPRLYEFAEARDLFSYGGF